MKKGITIKMCSNSYLYIIIITVYDETIKVQIQRERLPVLANPTRYQKVMFKLVNLACLLTLLVCEPCLADSVPASPAEGRSVARMRRGIPKQVFACDGVTATSCEDGVCQILCDDSTVVRYY